MMPGREKLEPMAQRLTPEEQARMLAVIEWAAGAREQQLKERGGELFPDAGEMIHEMRYGPDDGFRSESQ